MPPRPHNRQTVDDTTSAQDRNLTPWVMFYDFSDKSKDPIPVNPFASSFENAHLTKRFKIPSYPRFGEYVIIAGIEYIVSKVVHKLSHIRGQVINIYLTRVTSYPLNHSSDSH